MSRTIHKLNHKIAAIKKNMANRCEIDLFVGHKCTQTHNRYLSLLPLLTQLSRSYLMCGRHFSTDNGESSNGDKTNDRFKRRTRRIQTENMRTSPSNTNYDILGIHPNASQKEIKSAYFEKSKQFHPDVNDSLDARHRFSEVNEAYEVLSNADSKLAYDRNIFGVVLRSPNRNNNSNGNHSKSETDDEDYTLKWKQRQQQKQTAYNSHTRYTDEDYIRYKKRRMDYNFMDYEAADLYSKNLYREKYEKMIHEENLNASKEFDEYLENQKDYNLRLAMSVTMGLLIYSLIRFAAEDFDYSRFFFDKNASKADIINDAKKNALLLNRDVQNETDDQHKT